MTLGGWICMLTAVTIVTVLFVWCCWKVVTTSSTDEEKISERNQESEWKRPESATSKLVQKSGKKGCKLGEIVKMRVNRSSQPARRKFKQFQKH